MGEGVAAMVKAICQLLLCMQSKCQTTKTSFGITIDVVLTSVVTNVVWVKIVVSAFQGVCSVGQDLMLNHWPGASHHALNSPAHAKLRLETWRVLEDFYHAGR